MIRHLDNGLTVEVNQLTSGKYKAYLYDPADSFDLSINRGTYTSDTENDAVSSLLGKVYGNSIPKFLDAPAPPVVSVADFLRTLDVDLLAKDVTYRGQTLRPIGLLGNISFEIELAVGRKQSSFSNEDYVDPKYRDSYIQACQFLGLKCEFVPTAGDGYLKVSW